MTGNPQPEEITPTVSRPERGRGKTPMVLFCLLSLSMVAYFALGLSPIRAGDAHEYLLMTQAWQNHGSPDIRPADIDSHIELLGRSGELSAEPLPGEYYRRDSFTSKTGKVYFGHFWFYSLLAVPAWAVLRLAGGNEMAALQTINALFFCLAAGFVLFGGREKRGDRLLLLALSAIGPVIWYLRWPHPEVYTWSAVLISVVLLRRGRFGWAALFASFGALQNPPLLLLALLAVALAAIRRNWRAAALAAAGAALSFLPALFYLALFGVPNLIVAGGGADLALISPGRMWSLLTDLNLGMLPYVPLVLLLGLLGGAAALVRGRARGILVLAVLLGMIFLVGAQRNWNAGSAGMIRYAVWMVPLLAWLAVEFVPRGRWLAWVVGAGLLLQAGMVVTHDGREDYLRQGAPARFVLTHCPKLYNPDPQIFADRQLGREVTYWGGQLPVPFVTEAGYVTKLLVDGKTRRTLSEYFPIEQAEAWLTEQEAARTEGLTYLHPPRGKLRVVEPEGMDPAVFARQLQVRLLEIPDRVSGPQLEITVEVTNQGPFAYWGKRSCAPLPLRLGYRVYRDGEVMSSGRAPMPFLLKPGAVTVRNMSIVLPRPPGHYSLTIGTLIEQLVWSHSTARLTVDCPRAEQGHYRLSVEDPGGSSSPERPRNGGWVE